MSDLLPMVLALGVGTASLLLATRLKHRWEQKVDAAWQAAARQVRGKFQPHAHHAVERGREAPHRRIDAEIDDIEITATLYSATPEHGRMTMTVVRGKAKAPLDLGVRVDRSAFLTMGELFKSGHVRVGDADFDAQFSVRSNDRVQARVWLSPRVQRGMTAIRDWRFQLEGGVVTAERVGVEQDGSVLGRVLRVVALFARRGTDAMGEWRALAKLLDGELVPSQGGAKGVWDPECALRVPRLGVDVRITLATLDDEVVTRVEATSLGPRPDAGGSTNPAKNQVVPVDVKATLELLPVASLENAFENGGSTVRLDLRDVTLDAESLDRAVDVVARLAVSAATGPYR